MRALIVAYYFPPKGGAGTQRFAKFCKYLPAEGVEPVVLTVDEAHSSQFAPHDDRSLVGAGAPRTVRVSAPPAAAVPRLLRLRRKLRLVIDGDEWVHAAGQRAIELARRESFDVVVTTLSPYACYRIGERLQRELGIPWVVDLRDPWALDGWRVYPSPLHARVDRREMRRALRRADFVVANVPEAAREFVALGAAPGRTVVIPNGFDPEDFDGAAVPPPRPLDAPFRLVHVGTLHPADLPPGMTRNTLRRVRLRQLEPIGRTGQPLLHAVAAFRDRVGAVEAERRLRVEFFGWVDDSHTALIERLGLGRIVVQHGYVAHGDSVAALLTADAVFVPLHGVPAGERALVVPGKLYEALASGRPVLAALPPGDGADLVQSVDGGIVVPPTDVARLAEVLAGWIERRAAGDPPTGCARAQLGAFTRRALTARLAAVLRGAAERRPSIHLPSPWHGLVQPSESA